MTTHVKIWATAALFAVALSFGAQAEILVGVAVPSSGPKVALGQMILDTIEREVAALNAAGGIKGEQLKIQIEDDTCSTDGGAAVAGKLVASNIALVLGHPCSNAAIAAAKVYAAAKTLFVAIGARQPELTAKRAGPTIFRIGGRDDRQATETAGIFAPLLTGQRVAIVHDRTAYSKNMADGVSAALAAKGVVNITKATIVAGEKTYENLIAQLKTAQIQAIYFAGFQAEVDLIINGLEAAGISARYIGCDALSGMTRPRLVVMTPRQLGPDDITGIVAGSITGEYLVRTDNPLLNKQVWDHNGDELLPSYVPIPAPLE